MPESAKQPDRWPTRKLATVVAGAPTIYALLGDAVGEVWPQIAPAALAGGAMTAFVGMAASTVLAGGVPDRPNSERFAVLKAVTVRIRSSVWQDRARLAVLALTTAASLASGENLTPGTRS